jgi:NADPH-dependent glutamate synthase beta subunit-like oxidoreductase
VNPTNIQDPEYFHKVVDCQYAVRRTLLFPSIRLIAAERYSEAYMINWESNVFPGAGPHLRPCPAARLPTRAHGRTTRGNLPSETGGRRFKGDVNAMMPTGPFKPNGKKVALIGGGPASLTVRAIWPRSAMKFTCSTNNRPGAA